MAEKPTYEELERRVIELERIESERSEAERALREREKTYRLLVQHIPQKMFIKDANSVYESCNELFARDVGAYPEDVLGKTDHDFYPKELADKYRADDQRVMVSGKVKKIEERYVKDGEETWIHILKAPVYDADGRITGILGIFSDITAEKRAHEALRASEAQKAAILDGITTNLAFVNETLEILWANKAAADSVNRTLADMVGHKCHELWANPEAPCEGCPTAKAFETGKTEQEIMHTPDGRVWDEKGEPVFDEEGKLIGVLEIAHDVTSKVRAETAIRESEEKFRTLFDASPQAIALTDVEPGRFLDVNETFCRLSKFSKNELIGKTTTEMGFYSEDERTRFVQELTTNGRVDGSGMDFSLKDGTIINTQMFAVPIQIGDKSIILTSFFDTTDLNRMKAQIQETQKMEAIATLAGGVAHEFNNALTTVMGNMELLKMDLPEQEVYERYIKAVEQSGRRMSHLTGQLLAYAQGGKYQPRHLKLDEFVIQSLPILQHGIKPSVRVETNLQRETAAIEADRTQIQMILSALMANADEAISEAGVIQITVQNEDLDSVFCEKRYRLSPGPHVCLKVKDDGRGMCGEEMGKIFDPFFTTKFQGRGMGMAAVYGIVKNHGGWISVDSAPNRGTVVRIYFPAVPSDQ